MNIMKKCKDIKLQFADFTDRFFFHHPYFGFLFATIGMPLLILAAVAVCTTVIMLPISYFMGWL